MKKSVSSQVRAFTLIELMVVVAIIALLTGIVMTNLSSSKGKARDSKRVSDIGQLQLTLELYFDRCKQYPSLISGDISTINNGCPNGSGITLGSYISKIPTDPNGAVYDYAVNGTPPTDYVLRAKLEYPSVASSDSLGASAPSYASSFACDNVLSYCRGPK